MEVVGSRKKTKRVETRHGDTSASQMYASAALPQSNDKLHRGYGNLGFAKQTLIVICYRVSSSQAVISVDGGPAAHARGPPPLMVCAADVVLLISS